MPNKSKSITMTGKEIDEEIEVIIEELAGKLAPLIVAFVNKYADPDNGKMNKKMELLLYMGAITDDPKSNPDRRDIYEIVWSAVDRARDKAPDMFG